MRKFNLITCFLLSVSFILVGCVDQDYDLQKKDINTDITIGSGLTLPLGNIAKKSLGDLLNADELKELKENEDGSYKLYVKDSIKQSFALGSIDDITIPSPTIPAIVPDFGATGKFPDFVLQRDEFPIGGTTIHFPSVSGLQIPAIAVNTGIVLPAWLADIPFGTPLGGDDPFGLKLFYPINSLDPTRPSTDYVSVPFVMNYALPENLSQIKELVLSDTKIRIMVDLSDVSALLGVDNGHYFTMEMEFPQQFALSDIPGDGVTINHNKNTVIISWQVEKTDPRKKTFEFTISKITPRPVIGGDYSNSDYKLVNEVKHLDINSTIGYRLSYNITGIKNSTATPPTSPKIAVEFNITPKLDYANVDISKIAIPNITQNITLNTKIASIPTELKEVNKITFAANPVKPALNIKITPGQAMPLDFDPGSKVQILFPSSFSFVADQQDKGLKFVEGAGWTLEIPATKLFDPHSLLLDAIDLTGYNIVDGVIDFAQAGKPMVIRVVGEGLSVSKEGFHCRLNGATEFSTAMKFGAINMNLAIESAEVRAVMSTKFSESSKTSQVMAKPKELIALSAINLVKDATHGNKIDFGMKITGIPDGIKTIDFSNVVISMPKFVKLRDSAVEGIVVDNSDPDLTLVKINKQFTVSKSAVALDVNMVVDKLLFAKSPIANDKIQIDFNVGFAGSINIPESKISTDQLNDIKVTPTINIDNLAIASVVGKFDVDFQIDPMDVQLGDMSFDKAEINFALFDAIFNIDIFNPTSLPIGLQLSLLPKGSDGKVIDAQKIEIDPITIAPNGLTKLEISKDAKDKTTTDGDVTGIKKNMAQLFYPIMPSSVEIHVVPGIDKSVEHTVVLQKEDYELKVKYDIDIPLKFDKTFNVRYKDAIRDIKADLGDVVDVLSSLQVDLDIENAIPLELLVNITPLDIDSVSLADKIDIGLYRRSASSNDCTIAAGDSDAASITDLKLIFKEKEKGALKNLDGLSFEIVARPNQNSTNGAALNKKQYIHIKNIKARVIEDINISLDKKTEK